MSVLSITASVASVMSAVHSSTGGMLLFAADSDSGDDKTVLVAIIGAVGLVLATAITAVSAAYKRSPAVSQNDLITKQYIQSLERDRKDYNRLQGKHNHLREACIERGLDPDFLIHQQETT